jgi:hypothetical protein
MTNKENQIEGYPKPLTSLPHCSSALSFPPFLLEAAPPDIARQSPEPSQTTKSSLTPSFGVRLRVSTVSLAPLTNMDSLLDLRVDLHHLVVQFGVITAHDGWVPTSRDEDGLDTTGDRSGEDGADLKTDEEGEGHDDGGEATILVVGGRSKVEVQVGEERGGVTDEDTAERENGANEAVLEWVSTGADTLFVVERLTLTSASIPRSFIMAQVSFAAGMYALP